MGMEAPGLTCILPRMANDGEKRGAERLRVYWLSQDFLDAVGCLLESVPVKGSLGEQLRRAAESIMLNIREGASHISPGKKLYHFQLSHASADECIGALHGFARRYPRMNFTREIRMANMICVMMVALIRAQEERGE